ncbi:MAG: 5-oxoprolinase/urea amidolyase family protein, partial [Actinomycetota bacterium]|nr:5-oxoprolinase/urea amidolyase family protein [Actinomycetota bacterium]
PRLARVPRLATPRVSVPAGSVAIAGGLAAVYPSASPGGWRLIGQTSARLWDPGRAEPSLLTPGRRVRFRADRADRTGPARAAGLPGETRTARGRRPQRADADRAGPGRPASQLEIIRTGPLASVQDLGRPGLGAVGVPRSGAADPAALITANHLVGNPAGAAGLEFTLGRAAIRCDGDARLAVTGAPAPVGLAAPDGTERPAPFGAPFEVPGGWLVRLGAPAAGLRSYLAVAGGIATDPVLGSRSCDLLSGLGGGALRPGDRLPLGPPSAGPGSAPAAGHGAARIPGRGETTRLRVLPGPRQDWFDDDALAALCGSPYTVTPASNRTGLRLDGPALPRRHDTELPSEGMATGSLQVPHDGSPILLLADHPTTGGYPVIAVVHSADLRLAAQLRPGDQVRFCPG